MIRFSADVVYLSIFKLAVINNRRRHNLRWIRCAIQWDKFRFIGIQINIRTTRICCAEINSEIVWIFFLLFNLYIQDILILWSFLAIGFDSEIDRISFRCDAICRNQQVNILIFTTTNLDRIFNNL